MKIKRESSPSASNETTKKQKKSSSLAQNSPSRSCSTYQQKKEKAEVKIVPESNDPQVASYQEINQDRTIHLLTENISKIKSELDQKRKKESPQKGRSNSSDSTKVVYSQIEIKMKQRNNEMKTCDNEKIIAGFYGGTGCGKSFLINQLIGINLLTSKTGGASAHQANSSGCTQYPVKLKFESDAVKKYKVEVEVQGNKKCKSNSYSTKEEVFARINEINVEKTSGISNIVVRIPQNALNERNSFLKNVELIDMIGVPDNDLKELAHRRNLFAIQQGLDVAFIVKRDSFDRGTIYPNDLNNLEDSDIFKRTFQASNVHIPKLVATWAFDCDKINLVDKSSSSSDFSKNMPLDKENYKNYLYLSILCATKKKIDQSTQNKLNLIEQEAEFQKAKNCETVRLELKNAESKEMEQRISSFLYYPEKHPLRQESIELFSEIINEAKQFKRLKLFNRLLFQLSEINTNLMCKFFSVMTRQKDDIMFKSINIYKRSQKKDANNKKMIQIEVDRLYEDIQNIHKETEKKTNVPASQIKIYFKSQLDTLITKRIDIIAEIFMSYIESIIEFYNKKVNNKDKYKINYSLDRFFMTDFIKSTIQNRFESKKLIEIEDLIKSISTSDKENIESTLISKYEAIKDEIYYEVSESTSKSGILKSLEENKTLIEEYQIKREDEDFLDKPNKPILLTGENCTKITSSTSILNEIKKAKDKYDLEKIIVILKSSQLHTKSINPDRKKKIKQMLKNILEWKTKTFDFFPRDLQDITSIEMNYKFNTDVSVMRLSFDSEKFNLQMITEDKTQLNKKLADLEENMLTAKKDLNSNDNYIFLHPIFIWLNLSNIILEKTNKTIYNFIKNISNTIKCGQFIVFLFVEKNNQPQEQHKYERSLIKLLQLLETIDSKIGESLVAVFINDDQVQFEKVKTYMFSLAKNLKIDKFYSIDDSIGDFSEYSNKLEEFKTHKNCTARALDFMSTVLSHGMYSEEIEISNEDLYDIKSFIGYLFEEDLIISDDRDSANRSIDEYSKLKIKNKEFLNSVEKLLRITQVSDRKKEKKQRLLDMLTSGKTNHLGEIYLVPSDFFKNQSASKLKSRLNSNCVTKFTHKHQRAKSHGVILYNAKAFNSILPFEIDSNDQNKVETIKIETPIESGKTAKRKMEVFTEEDFYYYKLINAISGYVVYYFTYENYNQSDDEGVITEKTLIERWPLPIYQINPDANKVSNPPDESIEIKIAPWNEFENEMHDMYLNDSDKLYKVPDISLREKSFRFELRLQEFILDLFKEIFIKSDYFDEKYEFSFGDAGNDADNIFANQKGQRIIDIEIKNDNVFSSLGSKNLHDHLITSKKKNKYTLNSFVQICGYMKNHTIKYGVLTSYNRSWFLKLVHTNQPGKDQILISNTIERNFFLKAMCYLIRLSLNGVDLD